MPGINIFSLLSGGQQRAVRDAYAGSYAQDVGDAQRAISAASARSGINPAAAGRQYAQQQQIAMAQRAEARQRAMAAARVADDQAVSQLIGTGIGAAGTLGAMLVPGAQAAAPAAGAAGQAVGQAVAPPQSATAPVAAPVASAASAAPAAARPQQPEEDPLGPLAMVLGGRMVG